MKTTLKDMLREARSGFGDYEDAEAIVRRAAEVALLFATENESHHVHYSCAAGVAHAILADAGLKDE